MADSDIKKYSAEICRIAEKLYSDEWSGKYTGSQEKFRDWLNAKTGLNVNHINYDQRESALFAWMNALKNLESMS